MVNRVISRRDIGGNIVWMLILAEILVVMVVISMLGTTPTRILEVICDLSLFDIM